MLFEHRNDPLLPRREFLYRVILYSVFSFGLMFVSLGAGILGYHVLAGFDWTDSFLNAAMIMGGMGPVDQLPTRASKIFAGTYALYCGLVLLVSAGIFLSPIAHRLLHRFHVDIEEGD